MTQMDYPLLVFAFSMLLQLWAVWIGANVIRKLRSYEEAKRADFGVILGATLTLLGLVIGFAFSMAINRYDQRKNLEAAEASAIGTEYMQADLLPAADAARVRALLKDYLYQRVLTYTTRDNSATRQISAPTAKLQTQLWSTIVTSARGTVIPAVSLTVSGMNSVLDSQGHAQAAWRNRIPTEAWVLMMTIAVCCQLLIGYGAHDVKAEFFLMLVLPFLLSVSFFLIADIDSPHGGIIRVHPDNLQTLAESLR